MTGGQGWLQVLILIPRIVIVRLKMNEVAPRTELF